MGILQVLRFEFQKFRILEILNFHPCLYTLVAISQTISTQVRQLLLNLNRIHSVCFNDLSMKVDHGSDNLLGLVWVQTVAKVINRGHKSPLVGKEMLKVYILESMGL